MNKDDFSYHLDQLLEVAIDTARRASTILIEGFSKPHTLDYKNGRHNIVTECDKLSERFIKTTLKKAFPDHGFFGEETGLDLVNNQKICWVVDPLDGTVNFAHQIPFFSISIAATIGDQVLCGVVYSPMTNELFYAKHLQGAFLNEKPLKTSAISQIEQGIFVTGFPYNLQENPGSCIEHFVAFAKKGVPIRRLGSAALDLAYVAAGRFDGFWEISLEPWDFSAAALLIKEAGGMISTYDGDPLHPQKTSSVLATNSYLHKSMQTLIQQSTAK